MDLLSYLLLLVTFSQILSQSSGADDADGITKTLDKFSKFIYGPLWKYREFCGDYRDSASEFYDDHEINRFFNGTILNSAVTSNGYIPPDKLDQLIYSGIKARTYTPHTCASGSWGYAEDDIYDKSQSPKNDPNLCRKSIDELFISNRISSGVTDDILANNSNTINNEDEKRVINLPHGRYTILDHFGRAPSGPLYHNHLWTGDFKRCVSTEGWRYCMGSFESPNWPKESSNRAPQKLAVRVGMCLPDTCDEKAVKSREYLEKLEWLVKMDGNIGPINHYNLTDVYCPPSLDSEYYKPLNDPLSIFLALMALLWFSLVLYSNILIRYNGPLRNSSLGEFCRIFDIEQNWKQFTKSDRGDPRLYGFNTLKVVFMNWLIISHMFFLSTPYIANLQDFREAGHTYPIMSGFSQGHNILAAFFVISGIMSVYRYFRNGKTPQNITVDGAVRLIVQRYLRLVPYYIVIYAYLKQFGYLMSSGPMWDHGVSIQSEARQCRIESWFVPFLLLSSLISPGPHCILAGWQVANDVQVFLLMPILLFAYQRSHLLGRLTTIALISITQLHQILIPFKEPSFTWPGVAQEALTYGPRFIADKLVYHYTNPIGRSGGFLLGVLLVDIVFTRPKESFLKEKSLFRSTLDISIFVTGITLLSASLFMLVLPVYIRSGLAIVGDDLAFNINRWNSEIGWAFICYFLLTKNHDNMKISGTKVTPKVANGGSREESSELTNRLTTNEHQSLSMVEHRWQQSSLVKKKTMSMLGSFLTSRYWGVLVKLNFTIMLVHFRILRLVVQSQGQPVQYTMFGLFATSVGVLILCNVASLVLHLLVEVPLAILIRKIY